MITIRAFVARLLLVMAAAVMLAACGSGPKPFDKQAAPSGNTPPAILLAPLAGVPADKAEVLASELADTASARDIAIVEGDFADAWKLSGAFEAALDGGTSVVAYRWTLIDEQGRTIHTIDGRENGRAATGDAWSGIDPDVMRRIASATAESLAARLSQLGFATRTSAISPPLTVLTKAGPNAENEIDLETWFGPNASPSAALTLSPGAAPAAVEAPASTGEPADLRDDAPLDAEARPAPEEPAPVRTAAAGEIRAVAVTRVTGSGGPGRRELLSAMRQVLADAGWPVLTAPRGDALEIAGDIGMSPPAGGRQKVVINWTVTTPQGAELGNIRQANQVPAGALDKSWGANARAAAEAAARGIFEIVDKARRAG